MVHFFETRCEVFCHVASFVCKNHLSSDMRKWTLTFGFGRWSPDRAPTRSLRNTPSEWVGGDWPMTDTHQRRCGFVLWKLWSWWTFKWHLNKWFCSLILFCFGFVVIVRLCFLFPQFCFLLRALMSPLFSSSVFSCFDPETCAHTHSRSHADRVLFWTVTSCNWYKTSSVKMTLWCYTELITTALLSSFCWSAKICSCISR